MPWIRRALAPFPRLKRLLKSVYYSMEGTPQVCYSQISKDAIREYVGKPDPTILEIGCNNGANTLWFLEIFQRPKIYCFEPDPRAVGRFRRKVGPHANVQLFEIALGDSNGERTFYQSGYRGGEPADPAMPKEWDLSGSLRKPKNHLLVHPWIAFQQTITVRTATLDAWCEEHGVEKIDFLWMDVQGAEIDVFRGGVETLPKVRYLYTEYSDRELYEGQSSLKQLLAHLRDFAVVARYPGDVLLKNKRL